MPRTYFSFLQNDHCLSHAQSSWRSALGSLPYPIHSFFLIFQSPTWKHPPPGVLPWSFPLLPAGLAWNWVPPAFPKHPLFDAPIINHFPHLKVMRVDSVFSQRLAHAWLLNTSQTIRDKKSKFLKKKKNSGSCVNIDGKALKRKQMSYWNFIRKVKTAVQECTHNRK